MDIGDRAAAQEKRFRDQALAAHGNAKRIMADSLSECIDCDEAISEARRKAAPGCERCLSCQEEHEKESK